MGRKILTKEVMATIPAMVASGIRAAAIAERLGVNLGTLKVRASQCKISLRVPGSKRGRPAGFCNAFIRNLHLTPMAIDYYRMRAGDDDVSVVELVAKLLEVIAKDDLYNAVLDIEPVQEAA